MAGTPHVSGTVISSADLNDRVKVYDRVTAALEVANTTVETIVYSKSIGAQHLSSDRALRLTLIGDYLHSVGGNTGITTRIKFGGTTIFGHNVSGIAPDADRIPYRLEFELANLGATNVQFLRGWQSPFATPSAGSVAGLIATGSALHFSSAGTTAIGTTTAQTLEVTVQHDSALSTISFRRHYANLELL